MTYNFPEEDVTGFVAESKLDLIRSLKSERLLKSKQVEEALLHVPRENFLWPDTPRSLAYIDEPASLGDTGQTISAPHMIVIMLEELRLSPGLKVLEIGTGSGYNTALIADIVSRGVGSSKTPLVVSVERNGELVNFARKNLERIGLSSFCEVVEGDGSLGYPQESNNEIYDRIIVTAGSPRVPTFLKKQLKTDGIMEVPVGEGWSQKLTILKKNSKGEFEEKRSVECVFVPLIGSDAHPASA